ncbi:8436_t:CDS:2 [Funneliformis geosporum]|uniref:7678_t:CDS:1 n=1 Tax=Funneliformis geosporum TaxID=1117311 RepID=A0A9W4X3C3_9GLOM|nr:8436_t:CDS:2 [Funneliformis geosporum]CAI2183465.1 7678_t:CDS:2 [Funneliformis geosporum]
MDPRPLPPGFISEFDPNTQRYYYIDKSTGNSQWNHPLDMKPPLQPMIEQTSSQYPQQFPSPINQQGHYPLGFTDTSLLPSSDQRSTSSFPQPPYPQPTSSNYPPPYPQPGPELYPQSRQSNYPPYGEAQTYVGGPSRSHDNHGPEDKGIGKVLLGAGGGKVLLGAGGGLLAGKYAKKKFKKKFKGWKGGKGWKGKGGWKGWK